MENLTRNPQRQRHEKQLVHAKYYAFIQMARRNECMNYKHGINIIRNEI